MVIKKALPRAPVVLSFEEYHRVVKVVELLAAVAQRVNARSVEGKCVSANHPTPYVAMDGRRAGERCGKGQRLTDSKRKSSEEKGTGLKQKQKNKVRKICGPCFLNQIIYHESVNMVFQ